MTDKFMDSLIFKMALYATPDKNISVSIRATVRATPRVRRTNTGMRARNVALRRSMYAVFIFPSPHFGLWTVGQNQICIFKKNMPY